MTDGQIRQLNAYVKLMSKIIDYYDMYGSYFGYPACCTMHFIYDLTRGNDFGEVRRKAGDKTGFIPCKNCAELVLHGQMRLADLIQCRVCPTPFPYGGHKEVPELEAFRKLYEDGLQNEPPDKVSADRSRDNRSRGRKHNAKKRSDYPFRRNGGGRSQQWRRR